MIRNDQNNNKKMLKIAATCQLSLTMHCFQPLTTISKLAKKNKQTNKTASTKVKLLGLNNEN